MHLGHSTVRLQRQGPAWVFAHTCVAVRFLLSLLLPQVHRTGTVVEPPSAAAREALENWRKNHGRTPSGGVCFLGVDIEFYKGTTSPWSVTVTDIVTGAIIMDLRVSSPTHKPLKAGKRLYTLEQVASLLREGAQQYAGDRLVVWYHWGGSEPSKLKLRRSGVVVDAARLPPFVVGHGGHSRRLDLVAKRFLGMAFKQAFPHDGTGHCAALDVELMSWLLRMAAAHIMNLELLLDAMLERF